MRIFQLRRTNTGGVCLRTVSCNVATHLSSCVARSAGPPPNSSPGSIADVNQERGLPVSTSPGVFGCFQPDTEQPPVVIDLSGRAIAVDQTAAGSSCFPWCRLTLRCVSAYTDAVCVCSMYWATTLLLSIHTYITGVAISSQQPSALKTRFIPPLQ